MRQRLFIGVELSETVKQKLAGIVSKLSKKYPRLRWVKQDNFHLTLKFLGPSQADVQMIGQHLADRLARIPAFTVEYGQLGQFIRGEKSITVWIEVIKNESLLSIYHIINNALKTFQFGQEKMAYHPHITLGRGKNIQPLNLANIPKSKFDPMRVDKIVLFKSKLTRQGVDYQPLVSCPLSVYSG